jgi:hypothetical protein
MAMKEPSAAWSPETEGFEDVLSFGELERLKRLIDKACKLFWLKRRKLKEVLDAERRFNRPPTISLT